MNNKIFKLIFIVVAGLFFTFIITLFYGIFVLPRLNKNVFCIQSLSRSCFLKTPICANFPNPCFTPPLWFPAKNSNLNF